MFYILLAIVHFLHRAHSVENSNVSPHSGTDVSKILSD